MPRSLSSRPRGRRPAPAGRLPRGLDDEIRRTVRPADQRDARARLMRAIELLERGDAGAAVTEAEKARRLAPRSSGAREVLGLAYYGAGRWREAVAELKAYRRITGRVDQNHLIADALRGMGRPHEAVPLAEEELAGEAPEAAKAEAAIVAASALADLGRFPEALAFLGRVKADRDASRPHTLRLWYTRGDILERAGRRAEAAEEFRRVVRHEASAFDAAERLAQLS
jgi:tetratricopeptide (TPR) repeat protein